MPRDPASSCMIHPGEPCDTSTIFLDIEAWTLQLSHKTTKEHVYIKKLHQQIKEILWNNFATSVNQETSRWTSAQVSIVLLWKTIQKKLQARNSYPWLVLFSFGICTDGFMDRISSSHGCSTTEGLARKIVTGSGLRSRWEKCPTSGDGARSILHCIDWCIDWHEALASNNWWFDWYRLMYQFIILSLR